MNEKSFTCHFDRFVFFEEEFERTILPKLILLKKQTEELKTFDFVDSNVGKTKEILNIELFNFLLKNKIFFQNFNSLFFSLRDSEKSMFFEKIEEKITGNYTKEIYRRFFHLFLRSLDEKQKNSFYYHLLTKSSPQSELKKFAKLYAQTFG